MKTNTDRYQVLQSDATTRLPVIFLIDQSFSMRMTFGGTPTGETVEKDGKTWHYAEGGKMLITTLLEGIKKYAEEIRGDTRASVCVELCVLSFGDNTHIIQDFQPISTETIDIDPNDANTNLGRAVKVAIQLLQRRKSEYTGYGIDCYQPQLVIFTDGMATDIGECKSIAAEVQTLMKAGKLVCVPFLIGTEEGAQVLSMFGPENEVFALDTQALLEVLKFLSGSAIAVSKSQAGDSGEETKKMLEALRKKAKDWKTI